MSTIPSRFVPRYFEIEQALRVRIAGLQPDDPMPSDAQLCAEFGVSRMTARNAVQRLAQEGLVYRVPGRGTFVAPAPTHRQAGNLLSFTEEMRRRGAVASSQLIERARRPASEDEQRALRLDAGAAVVAVRRLRLADEAPVAVEDTVLRDGVAEAVMAADLERSSLHATLRAAGFVPTVGRATLRAEAAATRDAPLLGVRRGSPLLVETRLIYDQHGRALEWTESRYAGDRYRLDVSFDVAPAE
jgi:GntR family transcriptional regulator